MEWNMEQNMERKEMIKDRYAAGLQVEAQFTACGIMTQLKTRTDCILFIKLSPQSVTLGLPQEQLTWLQVLNELLNVCIKMEFMLAHKEI